MPLARVVAMNPQLVIAFLRRYQIQPVWRADRPQRGRFREFYQCDVDVVGTNALAEAECVAIVHQALVELGFTAFKIRIERPTDFACHGVRDRALDKEVDILVAIDIKLDKIGEDGVRKNLLEQGFSVEQVDRLFDMLNTGSIPNVRA